MVTNEAKRENSEKKMKKRGIEKIYIRISVKKNGIWICKLHANLSLNHLAQRYFCINNVYLM